MKRILITGGTGFVGTWLCKPDFRIGIIDQWYTKCIGDSKSHKKDMQLNYDYIIHLAPVPVDFVIKCAKKTNATILFASSGAVYDTKPDKYAKLKIESEDKLLASGLDVRIARMFTFIGNGLPEHLAPMRLRLAYEKGDAMLVGSAIRSYMHAEDMARWLWKILLEGESGCVYDVGSDDPVDMMMLAHEIGKYSSGATFIRGYDFDEKRETYLPDIKPIQDDLGVEITIPFEQAVERFVRSYT